MWISGEAPHSIGIPIRIPAIVVLSHISIIVPMRLWCCPDLTSSSTKCDIHPSWIAGTPRIDFLTFIIILRTGWSLLSIRNPSFLWIPVHWPSGCSVISEVMTRCKVWEEKTEQGWGQLHYKRCLSFSWKGLTRLDVEGKMTGQGINRIVFIQLLEGMIIKRTMNKKLAKKAKYCLWKEQWMWNEPWIYEQESC